MAASRGATPPHIWVLTDDRPGNANQALGVADALALPFTVKTLTYNRLAALPNRLLGARWAHVAKAQAAALGPPWPDLVIAAGRRAAPVARAIKRRGGGSARLVQLMWPGRPVGDIDLIVAPEHDRLPAGIEAVRTLGAPNRVTPSSLAAAGKAWEDRLAVSGPRLALLVGGDTRRTRFDPAQAADLGRATRAMADHLGAEILVTTSRRTRPEAARALIEALGPVAHRHLWQAGRGDNPYLAYLALADALVVTGDSASMCTEACSTGKPVYIFAPPGLATPKIASLHRRLFERGLARALERDVPAEPYTPAAALDEAEAVATEIRRRFELPAST